MNLICWIINESNGWHKCVILRDRNLFWLRLRRVLLLLRCSSCASSCLKYVNFLVSKLNIRSSPHTVHNCMDNNLRTQCTGHSIEYCRRAVYFTCFDWHSTETECLVLGSKLFDFSFRREERLRVQFCEHGQVFFYKSRWQYSEHLYRVPCTQFVSILGSNLVFMKVTLA